MEVFHCWCSCAQTHVRTGGLIALKMYFSCALIYIFLLGFEYNFCINKFVFMNIIFIFLQSVTKNGTLGWRPIYIPDQRSFLYLKCPLFGHSELLFRKLATALFVFLIRFLKMFFFLFCFFAVSFVLVDGELLGGKPLTTGEPTLLCWK